MSEPEQTMTLTEAMASLGFTPTQMAELEADDERAWGWILWAREETKLKNPAGMILTKFRSGADAPDPNAWRGDAKAGRGPDYPTLLRCAEALVRHTGHEYRSGEELYVDDVRIDDDLEAEFARLGANARVGNGATLTDADRNRLLRTAAVMRERHEAGAEDRLEREKAFTVTYYLRQVAERRLTREFVLSSTIPRLRAQGLAAGDELAERLPQLTVSVPLEPAAVSGLPPSRRVDALAEILREAADRPCADCKQERPLVTYGSERVCRGCAERRDLAAVTVEF